jgi:hypothetical protein
MPVHIHELTSEVSVAAGELPLSPAQLDKLVALVLRKLGEKERQARLSKEATKLGQSAIPPLGIGS